MINHKIGSLVRWLWPAVAIVLLVVGAATRTYWLGPVQDWIRQIIAGRRAVPMLDEHGHDSGHAGQEAGSSSDHAEHDHGHDDTNTLALSPQAMRNVGLTPEFLRPVQMGSYQRSISVPGMIVERPGRTRVQVSSPMAAVVTHVHAVQGEAVLPGTMLFQLRITAEELVKTQTELLKSVGELDVENREIQRLSAAVASGAIPQKTMLDRQYAKEKLESLLNSQREALRLQGLSDRHLHDIEQNRRLLRELQIAAPHPDDHSEEELKLTERPLENASTSADVATDVGGHTSPVSFFSPEVPHDHSESHPTESPLILQDVRVHKGQTVAAGETLCTLADYSELYIEGLAFEQEVDLLTEAAKKGWNVTATLDRAGSTETLQQLQLIYTANEIHADSRAMPFYVGLSNQIVRDVASPNGLRFIDWKYRPGQRLQLQIPVQEWQDQVVVPIDAVAREGAEWYVFLKGPDHFERTAVHVIYRDATHAVIANDGTLQRGNIMAMRSAHQLLMALKNKSGGGMDPHAGHTH